MTFLQLVQALWQESGSGGSVPTTVTGQTGEKSRLVNWVEKADRWIQTQYTDWNFLWGQETIQTIADQSTYSPGATVSQYDRHAWFLDEQAIESIEYQKVKGEPFSLTPGVPGTAILLPNKTFRLDPIPDAVYDVRFDYWRSPLGMNGDSSVSLIPPIYHEVILGKALMYYAEYESAPEVMEKGKALFVEWFSALHARELPGDRYMHKVSEGNEMVITVE